MTSDPKVKTLDDEVDLSLFRELRDTEVPFWRKRRYHVVIMVFFGLVCFITLRANLSVGLVAMTKKTNVTLDNGTIVEEQEFDWDSKTQGYILSSYFYGYITTQMLGGILASRFGSHLIFGIGIGSNALLVLLTPVATKAHIGLLFTIRILQGIIAGGVYPSIMGIWAQWAPVYERSFMSNIAYTGNYIGLILAMSVSGLIVVSWNWEGVFYVFGIIGCIWYIAWVIIVKPNPEVDPFIHEAEKKYILESIGDRKTGKNIKHPWKDILTSGAVWAIAVANFIAMWATYMLMTQLPLFLSDTMSYDLDTTGVLSSIPYFGVICVLFVSGYFADWFQVKGYLTTGQVRRYWNCGAFITEMTFMLLTAFATTPALSILFISLTVGGSALAFSGYMVNALDIAPSHASIIHGLTNTFGCLAGILNPMVTGYIVTDKSPEQWQIVFFIAAAVYLFGAVYYTLFAKGVLQPWAKVDLEELATRNTMLKNKEDNNNSSSI